MTFILTRVFSFGQSCDTIEGRIFNCTDAKGKKNGIWKVQRKILNLSRHSGLGSKGGCKYFEYFRYETLAEGLYSDNKKTGIWKYYMDNGDMNYVEKEVTYNKNGTIIEKNYVDNSIIEFSNDSSIIKGYVWLNGDSIKIVYSNKKCSFKLNKSKVFKTFDCPNYYRFDFELWRLKYGHYNRDIKRITPH